MCAPKMEPTRTESVTQAEPQGNVSFEFYGLKIAIKLWDVLFDFLKFFSCYLVTLSSTRNFCGAIQKLCLVNFYKLQLFV